MLHILLEDSRQPTLAVPLAEALPSESTHASAGFILRGCFAQCVFQMVRMATGTNVGRRCSIATEAVFGSAE